MPFDPTALPNLVLYAEADQLSGPPAQGASVSTWPSPYGLGDLASSGGTPTYQAGDARSNNKPYLAFSHASSSYLQTANSGTITQYYAVVRSPDALWDYYGSILGSTSATLTDQLQNGGSTFQTRPSGVSVNGVAMDSNAAYYPLDPLDQWKVVKIEVLSPATSRTYRVANSQGNAGYYVSLHVAAILAFSADLGATDEAALTAYLMAKYLPAAPAAGTVPDAWDQPGRVHYLDAGQRVYGDYGGTAATDGGGVALWRGSGSNGIGWYQGTPGSQPTYLPTGLNGRPCVRFGGSAWLSCGLPPTLEALNGSSYTIVLAGRMRSDGFSTLLAHGLAASGTNARLWFADNSGFWERQNTLAASSSLSPGVPRSGAAFCLAYTFDQTDTDTGAETLYHAGDVAKVLGHAVPSWSTGQPWRLASYDGTNYTGTFDLARLAVYTGALTQTQVKAIAAEFAATYEPVRVFFEGDSLTAGTGATGTGDYPTQVVQGQSDPWQFLNVAVAGTASAAMLSRATTTVDPYLVFGPKNVVVLMTGANDFAGNQTATAVYANVKAYGQARKAAAAAAGVSLRFLVVTPPTDARQTTDQDAQRVAYNALLLASAVGEGWCDAVVDITADPYIGTETAYADNPSYWSDGTHLSNSGYAVLASYVLPSVQAAVALPDPPSSRGLNPGCRMGRGR